MGALANKSPDWTESEKESLAELISRFPPGIVAQKLHRSVNAVVVKAKRLGYSRRARDGWYTKREVSVILGVDHHKIQQWADQGWLQMKPHNPGSIPQKDGGACWEVTESDLKEFITYHADELFGRNVDIWQIVNILTGGAPC
jgi:hypothetical protein